MRRKLIVGALAGVGLAAGLILWQSAPSRATQEPGAETANGKAKRPDPLPIRHVVLFNSGVGYVQREGEVEGNSRVELTFPVGDINDLLKSLILQDLGGGRISSVNYDSHDPIDKILRSFALDLNNNPTYGQILNQARGEKIEVLRQEIKDGKPTARTTKVEGTIVGMEAQRKDWVAEEEFLNLHTPSGLQAVPLNQILAVRFLNANLESELQRALQVLARSHDTQKKTVSLGFNGAGKRPVKVGYVVERPIWKTSYRLRLEPNGKLFLQAWALVENTSDDDWNDIRMTLVSGRPISYKMNLYEPLYMPRPTVEPELFASLRPPLYAGAMMQEGENAVPGRSGQFGMLGGVFGGQGAPTQEGGPADIRRGGFGFGSFQGGSFGGGLAGLGGGLGGFGGGLAGLGGFQGGFNGMQGAFGFTGGFNGMQGGLNRYQIPKPQAPGFAWDAQQRLTYEELQQRREAQKKTVDDAKKTLGTVAGLNFKEGIDSAAAGEEIGDYYQYVIDQKVTLPRQKSAMLPILNQTVEGAKVSIYNETVHAKHPLLGLRVKNTSGQPLTQGPIAVYEGGAYAGDSRVLDLQPNEERLLSYAVDQGTEIKSAVASRISPEMTIEIGTHKLIAHFKYRETKTYLIKNRSRSDRQLVLEHPLRSDWDLVGGAKPKEKSRDTYRFVVGVPAGQLVKFEVPEEQGRVQQAALQMSDHAPPRFLLDDSVEVVPVTKTTLGDTMELKTVKQVLHARHTVRETRTYFIHNHSDQQRIFHVNHLVRPGWKLIGVKDDDKNPKVYRFKVVVPPGRTERHEVIEEQVRVEQFPLSAVEDKPARYVLALGVEVAPVVKATPEQLVDVKIAKGTVQARQKVRETTTFLVKNNLEKDRTFQFEHLVRPEWRRLEGAQLIQSGPGVYRFEVKVPAGKTGQHEIVEEKVYRLKDQALAEASEALLKEYIANAATSADVKAGLTKTLSLSAKLRESKRQLAEVQKQLSTLAEDQGRLRDNLKIIPQSAEPYKRFLQKFVDQETEIEGLQRSIRQLQTTVQNEQKEYDTLAATLTVE